MPATCGRSRLVRRYLNIIIPTIYLHNNLMAGFKFVADGGAPAVWRLDTSGNILAENILTVEGIKSI